MKNTDVVIVGAGPVGCVLANKLSSELNLKCLIIEKRNHIAGNCYDEYNKKGLLYPWRVYSKVLCKKKILSYTDKS